MRWLLLGAMAGLLPGCIYMNLDLSALGNRGFQETLVRGTSGPKVALLDVTGVITDSPRSGVLNFGGAPSLVAEFRESLERAADDDEVRAIVLRINSPGGSVSASETLHHEIIRWKAEHDRPVVAYLNGLATSGGYYLAVASDEVIAHPTAVTGSIGVIMSGLNFAGLLERFGVANQALTSGPYKDSGSALREMRPDEAAYLQEIVDDLYDRFVEVVDAGRPGLDRATVEKLADGRIYTARQALNAGLIDEIGYLDEALDKVAEHFGGGEFRVVTYHRGASRDNIYSRAGVPTPLVDIGLLPDSLDLSPGFYYLWPWALR